MPMDISFNPANNSFLHDISRGFEASPPYLTAAMNRAKKELMKDSSNPEKIKNYQEEYQKYKIASIAKSNIMKGEADLLLTLLQNLR